MPLSRRRFVGGFAAALTYLGVAPEGDLLAFGQSAASAPGGAPYLSDKIKKAMAEYDGYAKLSNNENPYGPPESVMKAMTDAFKYANRYGAPDGGIVDAIAAHHGVKTENVLIGEGSSELLDISDAAFTRGGRKVVGADPTYATIFQYAAGTNSEGILIPLRADYTQDIPAMIRAVKTNYRDIGLVYLCNPNNPTGRIVPKDEIKLLLESIPGDIPVFIDEAYHHYVDDPNYEPSTKYVIEGRKVIVARTFSKIAALAGMRLGYAVAPKELIDQLKPFVMTYNTNHLAKHGAVVALKDTANEVKVKLLNKQVRDGVTAEIRAMGYEVIPSQANFFMVNIKKDVTPVADEFLKRGVVVGRKFPPMNEFMRVSVGTQPEMDVFMKAFKEVFPVARQSKVG